MGVTSSQEMLAYEEKDIIQAVISNYQQLSAEELKKIFNKEKEEIFEALEKCLHVDFFYQCSIFNGSSNEKMVAEELKRQSEVTLPLKNN